MHFLIVGALPSSLVNFRGELMRTLVGAGHRVTAMSAPADDATIETLKRLGVAFRPFPIERNGLNPAADASTLVALRRAFKDLHPDVVLAYTIKPVIWSGLALRSLKLPTRFYGLITGLGYAFEGQGAARTAIRSAVIGLYRLAAARADAIIFQNEDNRAVFIQHAIVGAHRTAIVNGSGVDVARFSVTALPEGAVKFLLIARLLGDKGLREYADAARLVRKQQPSAQFHLVGPPDPSPDGIPLETVEAWHDSGDIIYHGAAADVRPFIASTHVYVLPSYHEGMPRTVLEAMAMGRPILTTAVSGCRETVVDGENGWLVPKQDATALAERMVWFIDNRDRWQDMAAASRRLAETRFDVHTVNAEMLRIMGVAAAEAVA